MRVGRLVPLLGLALGLTYGFAVEKMRLSPPLVMVGLGGMTLALCGMALWRAIDPLLQPEAASPLAPGSKLAPGRLREAEREKQAVLKAIKELEFDFQMRKVADADYREMAERYRTRAMRLIGEIDAGDDYRRLIERELKDRLAALQAAGAPLPVEGPRSPPKGGCGSCGSPNDSDAIFCKKCGVRIDR